MNLLADKLSFLPTVKDNWGIEVHGFYMFVLAKRLKNIKKHLRIIKRLNRNVFDKLKMLRVELKRVQSSLDKDPHCMHLREEEYVYCSAYKEAISDEEKVLRQKTKIQWLREGDHNSAYFHNMLKGRVHKNRIEVVYDDQGSEDEVFPIEDLESLFINKLDVQCANHMVRPILNDEIKFSMFSIEDDKAAGLDGFSLKFLKQHGMWLGEFMNGYGCKGGARRCAFKVDIAKAYDTEIHGVFKGKRGLRHGDPISLYLFTIAMEVLNLMVKRQIRLDGQFKFHWGVVKLSSLIYVLRMIC
nr:hypothetical protein [Tanacetum cinerariifolium]